MNLEVIRYSETVLSVLQDLRVIGTIGLIGLMTLVIMGTFDRLRPPK